MGGGRGVPESFGQKGPHHSVTGEEQPPAQQPQRDVQPVTRAGLVRVSEAPLLAPGPQPGLTHSLQVVRSQRQLCRGRSHGSEETRQQRVHYSRDHGEGRGAFSSGARVDTSRPRCPTPASVHNNPHCPRCSSPAALSAQRQQGASLHHQTDQCSEG